MNRSQLEHIIRAAAANADATDVVIIGSQALLGSFADPGSEVLVRSMEADVFPRRKPVGLSTRGWPHSKNDLPKGTARAILKPAGIKGKL